MIGTLINKLKSDFEGYSVRGGISFDDDTIKKALTTSNKMLFVNYVSNQTRGYYTNSDYQDFHILEIIIKADNDILTILETLKSNLQGYEFEFANQTWVVVFGGAVPMEAKLYDDREIKTFATTWSIM